jgi:hypothetical protein
LIRLRLLRLRALAFDAAGFCVFSFDPPSLESLLPAALFRICANRLGWNSSAIYAVFSALATLRFRRLRALTYDISRCFRMVAFGFAFDISSCVHSLSMPSACCGSASFRIVYIQQPTPQFIPIAFRIAVAFRFAFDIFTFVSYFSALRLLWISSANNAAACALVLPSISLEWFRYSSTLGFQEAPPHSLSRSMSTASFRIVAFSTSGVVPYRSTFHVFSFTQPVPFFIHLVARSCALREGE